jgi:hypothetical protein
VTKINDISKSISSELVRYSNLVKEEFEIAKEETAKNLVEDLKKTSPENTGSYKKGWTVKRVGNSLIVHNKTNYQLTHLLEKGHAKRNGGRVSARPHIGPAEQKHNQEFLKKIEKAIKK